MLANVVGAFLIPAVLAEQAENEWLIPLVGSTNEFRLLACTDVDAALRDHCTLEFNQDWKTRVDPTFRETPWELRHFFFYALVMVGTVTSEGAIAALYNPYVDVALVLHWKIRAADLKIERFAFVTGDTLRGDPGRPDTLLPQWMAHTGGAPVAAILASCERSLERFKERFPPHAPTVSIAGGFAPGTDLDLEIQKADDRMVLRVAYLDEILPPPERAGVTQAIDSILESIRRADPEGLLSQLPEDQDRYAVETILSLPQTERDTLRPHWYLRDGNVVLVFVSSPFSPRVFLSLRLEIPDAKPVKGAAFHVFDLTRELPEEGE